MMLYDVPLIVLCCFCKLLNVFGFLLHSPRHAACLQRDAKLATAEARPPREEPPGCAAMALGADAWSSIEPP